MRSSSSPLTLVLLPGLDGTGHHFRPLMECAPERFRLKVVSYPTDVVLDHVALVARVREQLPNQPYLLVAESFSGPIAVSIASQRPPQLLGLVLAASFVTPPALSVLRWLPWQIDFRLPVPLQLLRSFLSPRDEGLVQALKGTLQDVCPDVLAARVRQTLTIDKRRELVAIEAPILYLQAKRDRIVASRCLREILELQPDVIVEVLETAHPVLQIDPVGAWNRIEGFARQCQSKLADLAGGISR